MTTSDVRRTHNTTSDELSWEDKTHKKFHISIIDGFLEEAFSDALPIQISRCVKETAARCA